VGLISLFAIFGCASSQVDMGNSAFDHVDSDIVLVVSPAACLSCDGKLHRVLIAADDLRGLLSIVLSRPPTDLERRRLVLEGLPAGIPIEPGSAPSAPDRPFLMIRDSTGVVTRIEWESADSVITEVFARAQRRAPSQSNPV
jgi:hypothetical protein